MDSLRKVLLVDDERGQAKIVDATFGKFAGEKFQLHWAPSYEEGLIELRRGGYVACLLDYQLGDRDGLELLREAVRQGVQTPVIFLTSETSGEVDAQAMEAGALDYLVKGEINPRALERSLRYALKLHATLAELRRLATRDTLTGLFNRREGVRLLEREVERTKRDPHPLSALLVDVDHFKEVNDRKGGHAAGDALLTSVAKALQAQVRPEDSVVRWGGDEFAVWLADTDANAARLVAERMIAAVRTLGATISVGVAQWAPARSEAGDLIAAADKALYEAKWAGRDRVA
jgi:two-component system, cell cycle response regulator